jgi:hypothetical protein
MAMISEMERKHMSDRARAADREAAGFLRRVGFYNDHNKPAGVDAMVDEKAETARRLREARRDRRERERAAIEADIDARVREAIERERTVTIDTTLDIVGTAIGELLERNLGPVEKKLSELQTELRALSAERERLIGLTSSSSSLRSSRSAN